MQKKRVIQLPKTKVMSASNNLFNHMALYHKDLKLQKSRIWLDKIDIEVDLVFSIWTGLPVSRPVTFSCKSTEWKSQKALREKL